MSKPREFWIYRKSKRDICGFVSDCRQDVSHDDSYKEWNVIEKAAYDKAIAALKIYEREHDDSGLGACHAAFSKTADCTCGAALANKTLKEIGEL